MEPVSTTLPMAHRYMQNKINFNLLSNNKIMQNITVAVFYRDKGLSPLFKDILKVSSGSVFVMPKTTMLN